MNVKRNGCMGNTVPIKICKKHGGNSNCLYSKKVSLINNFREIQEIMIEDEANAAAAKLNKAEIEREEEKQENIQDKKEKIRRRNEKEEADKKRILIIGIIEAVLFAAMIALHITLSVLQSDSTGINVAGEPIYQN